MGARRSRWTTSLLATVTSGALAWAAPSEAARPSVVGGSGNVGVVADGIELTVKIHPRAPYGPGDRLTYVYVLQTDGTGDGSGGIVLTSRIGDHATYVPGSANCGGTYDAATKTVTLHSGPFYEWPSWTSCQLDVAIDSSPVGPPEIDFSDDFESGLGSWVVTHGAGSEDWALTANNQGHEVRAQDPATVS